MSEPTTAASEQIPSEIGKNDMTDQVEKMYQTCVYCMNNKRDSMYNEYSYKDEFLSWLNRMHSSDKISSEVKDTYIKKIACFLPEKISPQERASMFSR